MANPDKTRGPLIAVTGSSRPYIFDLPAVLSLPRDFEFRFRYRHIWVDPELQAQIAARPKELEGQPLILLFHSEQTRRVLPIRKCTIISVENLGPLIFVRFRMGSFPRID